MPARQRSKSASTRKKAPEPLQSVAKVSEGGWNLWHLIWDFLQHIREEIQEGEIWSTWRLLWAVFFFLLFGISLSAMVVALVHGNKPPVFFFCPMSCFAGWSLYEVLTSKNWFRMPKVFLVLLGIVSAICGIFMAIYVNNRWPDYFPDKLMSIYANMLLVYNMLPVTTAQGRCQGAREYLSMACCGTSDGSADQNKKAFSALGDCCASLAGSSNGWRAGSYGCYNGATITCPEFREATKALWAVGGKCHTVLAK